MARGRLSVQLFRVLTNLRIFFVVRNWRCCRLSFENLELRDFKNGRGKSQEKAKNLGERIVEFIQMGNVCIFRADIDAVTLHASGENYRHKHSSCKEVSFVTCVQMRKIFLERSPNFTHFGSGIRKTGTKLLTSLVWRQYRNFHLTLDVQLLYLVKTKHHKLHGRYSGIGFSHKPLLLNRLIFASQYHFTETRCRYVLAVRSSLSYVSSVRYQWSPEYAGSCILLLCFRTTDLFIEKVHH